MKDSMCKTSLLLIVTIVKVLFITIIKTREVDEVVCHIRTFCILLFSWRSLDIFDLELVTLKKTVASLPSVIFTYFMIPT